MKEAAKHRWGAEVAAREQNARKRQIQLSGRDIYDKRWEQRSQRSLLFYRKCHVWKIPQVKEWTGDTNTFRLHLMGSSRRLKKPFYEGSSEGNFSNKPFLWIQGASSSVWDRWQVVLSLAEIQSWKMIVGFLFQGTTTKCLIQSVKHK